LNRTGANESQSEEERRIKEPAVIRFPPDTVRYLAGAGLLLTAYLIAALLEAQNLAAGPAI